MDNRYEVLCLAGAQFYVQTRCPVGVVSVPCLCLPPSTGPFVPNRAAALPAATHLPPRRSHRVRVPVVAPVRGATAGISCLPPPASPAGPAAADRAVRGQGHQDGGECDTGAYEGHSTPRKERGGCSEVTGRQRKRQPGQTVDALCNVVLLGEVRTERCVVLT